MKKPWEFNVLVEFIVHICMDFSFFCLNRIFCMHLNVASRKKRIDLRVFNILCPP